MKSSLKNKLSFPLFIVLIAVLIASCKKDDEILKAPGIGSGDTTTVEVSPERKEEIFGQVNNFINGLSWEDRTSAHSRIEDFLKSIPEFREVNYSPEGDNVWAMFTDGTLYLVINNRPNDKDFTDTSFSSMRKDNSNKRLSEIRNSFLPSSNRVYLINSLGTSFRSSGYSQKNLNNLFNDKGYDVTLLDGTVENLKNVKDVGVFYFSTHGGFFKVKTDSIYAAWTSDSMSVSKEKAYKKDLSDRSLIYISAYHNIGPDGKDQAETHLAITSKFVKKYMSFSLNSIMYVDACESFMDNNFKWAFLEKSSHTGTFLGWSDNVDDKDAYASAAFFFDRMLAANSPYTSYHPEDPDQRAFDLPSIMNDMADKNLGISIPYSSQPGRMAVLAYKETPNQDLILRPSIAYLQLDELNDLLYIWGLFGEDLGEGAREVTIDGEPVEEIMAWDPALIICKIKNSGKGSAGDVVVKAWESKSHPRTLSDWRGTIKYQRPSEGTLMEEITFHLHLRGDIGKYREEPGQAPIPIPQSTFFKFPAKDSKATYSMGGSAAHTYTYGCTFKNSVTWSDNNGDFLLFDPVRNQDYTLSHFILTPELTETGFHIENFTPYIATKSTAFMKSFYECPDDSGENPVPNSEMSFGPFPEKFKTFDLQFDSNFNIKSGKLTEEETGRSGLPYGGDLIGDPYPTFQLTLEWNFEPVKFPPTKESAK